MTTRHYEATHIGIAASFALIERDVYDVFY